MIQVATPQREVNSSELQSTSPVSQNEENSSSNPRGKTNVRIDQQVPIAKLSSDLPTKLSERNVDREENFDEYTSNNTNKPVVSDIHHHDRPKSVSELADSGQKAVALYDYQACKFLIKRQNFSQRLVWNILPIFISY